MYHYFVNNIVNSIVYDIVSWAVLEWHYLCGGKDFEMRFHDLVTIV